MLQNTVVPRPSTCTTCGTPAVHPRIVQVNRGKDIVTEAHWVCPRCSNRFLVGTVNITSSETKKN
jgi:DNA-directed RNA polymerase subunit RPC12/RpoP